MSASTERARHDQLSLPIIGIVCEIACGRLLMSSKKTRIMYIENKANGLEGQARIGRITYSKTGRSLIYGDSIFIPIHGFKANFMNAGTLEYYWISGPKKRGRDRLYGTGIVAIDDDVRVEYWTEIRMQPEHQDQISYRD